MPGFIYYYGPNRSAQLKAERARHESRRVSKWESEKARSLAAHGWASPNARQEADHG